MLADTALLDAFESLGDNCEFGFVQRKSLIEPGGLLRWAVVPPAGLIKALGDRFAQIYAYEQLSPSGDMIRNCEYGIYLHSRMRSQTIDGELRFIAPEPDRRVIYAEEAAKAQYLVGKLVQQLQSSNKIFVYKRNAGVSDELIGSLLEALGTYNSRNVLLLVSTADAEPGTVWREGPNLVRACIDRLAPYEHADDVSLAQWLQICRRAYEMVRGTAA